MKARNRILLVLSLVFAVVLGACATGSTTETPATRTPRAATATPEVTPEPVDTITDATAEATTVAEATAETANIVETAVAGSDFTVLVQAIEAAGLVDALSADGPFTVFAPTDAAFTALLETLGLTAEELLGNTELLTSVLLYHVVAGSANAADLTNGQTLTTLSGLTLTVTIDGSTVMINDATVVQADIATSNGVIHVIDKVLVPTQMTEMATAPAEMTEMAEMTPVAEATIGEPFVDVVSGLGESTAEATEAVAVVEATEVAVEATEVPATTTVISNVCLVADQGGIKDGNFNALANVGMQRAEQDFGLQTQIIESDEPADYEPNMETCIRNGANVIVSVGFTQTDAARNIAIAYPEVFIIGVDQFYGEGQPANVVSLLFREDQAGFLVGVMAALVTKTNIIGGVYGRDVPAVVKFRHGFEEGARYINPEIVVLGQYTDRFDNPTLGATIAEQFIGEGADVIFGAGGGTGTGGIQYAAEQGVYVIGVDQDEYLTNFGAGDSPGAEFVISSALKSVDVGVYDMLAALSGDTTKTFFGGGTYMLEAANNGIGFADRHDSDLSDEVVARVQEVFEMLKAGELETNVDPVTGAFLVPPADMTPEAMMTSEPEVEATEAPSVEATESASVEATEAPVVVEATEMAVEATEVPATTTVISNVCLVADQGGIKDGNFNALANVGMQRAEQDFGLQTQIIESDEPADYEPNMETCIRNGANVIVSVGFTQTDAARNIAIAHPEVFIIGVDQFYGEGQPANVVSLLFREDQAGFLVGVMAALVTKTNIIGGVYGRDVPAVVKFRHGFEEGARYINPEIVVLGQYTDRFDNPTLGATIAEQFIGEGADVIFGAGGGTGTGGIQYAAEQGVYVIGVDQDEYLTNFGAGDSPGAEFVISSALKSVDVGVYDMLAALSGDTTKTFFGGGTYMLEAANNGIGFADRHDSDLSDEVVARVQEVFEMLKAGELETNVDPVTGAFLVPPADMTPEAMMTSEPEVEVTAEATPSN
ncbi:MAG: BMP family ABC transporter substrate-binding protein [bacterium]|nr:BMP family ABC transporter substrate-binding protein [bacterium]